jgi:hypothetical protein
MLKYLAIFVAILGLAVYVSIQSRCIVENAAQQQSAQSPNTPVSGGAPNELQQQNAGKVVPALPLWYGFFSWPDGVTAWAIILTLLAIAEQTKQTKKAAEAALASATAANAQIQVMQSQAGQMEAQTKILGDSVAAAREGSDAARRAVEITILKERAMIRIEVAGLEVKLLGKQSWVASVVVRIFNFGATKAFPIDSHAVLAISSSNEKYVAKYSHPLIDEAIIAPTELPMEKTVVTTTDINLDTIGTINSEQRFAHLYGSIGYSDVFGEKHRTSFRYLWKTNGWLLAASTVLGGDPHGTNALYGAWEKTLDGNDNEAF